MVKLSEKEKESCKKGRKVQVLLLLEKTVRMTSSELNKAMHMKGSNLWIYTRRLEENGLIEIYNETKFKRAEDVNFKYKYHSITDAGRELIRDLGK